MKNDFAKEKWVVVKPPHKYTNNLKIEVSNLGRVRTSTKIEQNRVLRGGTINGYPIVRFKLFRERDSKASGRLNRMRKQIDSVRDELNEITRTIKALGKKDRSYNKYKQQMAKAADLLKLLRADYKKAYHADELQRTINYAPLVHRLVAEKFSKRPSPKHSIVSHLDHNKKNNVATNLKWMTTEANSEHQQTSPVVIREKKKRIGRRPDTSKGFKLSEDRVRAIKKDMKSGYTMVKLSKKFNISETQLQRIKKGVNWGDVKAGK